MRVLVTGANGLLGTNVIVKLLEKGYYVRGMLRNKKNFLLPLNKYIELSEADLLNAGAVEEAVHGCNYIIHCAAVTAPGLLHYSDYECNIAGTQNIINAALKHNVKKMVYVSTANTLKFGSKAMPGNETATATKPFTNSLYAKSKIEAERYVRAATGKIDITIVNPSFMLGAYVSGNGSGKIIRMGYGRKWLFYPPGGKNFVNATDAAAATVAAMEKGKCGEAYLITGENMTYKEFFKKLNALQETRPVLVKLPPWLLMLCGATGSLLRILNIKTAISYTNMQILCTSNYYTNEKAARDLGCNFKPIENGMADGIAWLKLRSIIK